MTRGRPARPDEIPRYGSIWTWGSGGVKRMTLRLLGADRVTLVNLIVGTPNGKEVGQVSTMIWRDGSPVLEDWTCIDEGPE